MTTWTEVDDVPIDLQPRCEHGCHSARFQVDTGWWVLSVDEGHIDVLCEICRCSFDGLADGTELLYSEKDLPVKLTYVPDHPGLGQWHGPSGCDCGWSFSVEPRSERADAH